MTPRFIFVSGGVCSSLGKGIAAASIGALLQAQGYTVKLRKLEQYLNIDSGTMSPIQHGEVYVTNDGLEADLDFGHYERFTGVETKKTDYITMGRVYFEVLNKERRGDYLGSTIQVIPHITEEIKRFIMHDTFDTDVVIIEIGGTVGDIEGLAYLEAVRQLRNDLGKGRTLFVHLTLIPYIQSSGEIKTKPTQRSVNELQGLGIQPDILLCRSHYTLPEPAIDKIALFCNVPTNHVIPAYDAKDVYEVPLLLHEHGLDARICECFDIKHKSIDLKEWLSITRHFKPTQTVTIGLVGKYVELQDSYKSVIEAIKHACYAENVSHNIKLIDSEAVTGEDLKKLDGIIVPGGFGSRGTEGMIEAIQYARENKVPFLGICFGMQLCVIEFARHVLNLAGAGTTEFGQTDEPVVGLLEEWMSEQGLQKHNLLGYMGGTMRLGAAKCALKKGSLAHTLYGKDTISERHRHRYEVNYERYKDIFEEKGLIFSGATPDEHLPEIVEYKDHPFFIASQFHPEFLSSPFKPHPLFVGLVKKSLKSS